MIRKAFLMRIHPGCEAEYEERHNPIWPELKAMLREHGAHNYSIYLDAETSQLFVSVEMESEERWDAIARTDVCRRWWATMRELMPSHPDDSPEAVELRPVFYME